MERKVAGTTGDMRLIRRCRPASWCALADGAVVGRIYKANAAPVGNFTRRSGTAQWLAVMQAGIAEGPSRTPFRASSVP
jgi:hypothetical protein